METDQLLTETLATLIEAAREILKNGSPDLLLDMAETLSAIEQAVTEQSDGQPEEPYHSLKLCCTNALYSLSNIAACLEKQPERSRKKLEFELLPLLRIGYAKFYFATQIKGDPEREARFRKEEAMDLVKNEYVEKAERMGSYPYDISFYVIAYNKLDLTKQCLSFLLENLPRELRYELILVNHGSTDGTKEFFETIQADKQIDVRVNSGDGFLIPNMIVQGKYAVNISNDVLFTERAAEIMYEALEEDDRIAMGVPVTPNISNYQAIVPVDAVFNDDAEYRAFYKQFNRRDKRQEEQRVRLMTPAFILRTSLVNHSETPTQLFGMFSRLRFAFGDDVASLLYRRAGYKNILFRDIFCYHFPGGASILTSKDYWKGRMDFLKDFGVDAWGKGFCWSRTLFSDRLPCCDQVKAGRVLGINAGMGSDPLKVREMLKEVTGCFAIRLINYTMEQCFLADLQGISEEAYYVSGWPQLWMELQGSFDYILVCDGWEDQEIPDVMGRLFTHLSEGGVLIVQSTKEGAVQRFIRAYPRAVRLEEDGRYEPGSEEASPLYQAYCVKE